MARKIIIFTIDELNAIVKCLSRHDNEFNIPFSSDVKSFIKETGEEWKSTKNITQVRATTLSVDIYSFYFQNKIVMEEEILYFIKKIEENIEDGVARAFFDTANKIGRLLNRCAKRRFLEADVYFCDKDMLSAVLSVQEEYEAQLTTSYQQRYLGFNKILNILNDKEACFDYSVSYIPRSKTISVEKSVEHYINGEFEVWKNRLLNDTEEFIRTHLTKTTDIEKKRMEVNAEIEKAKDTHLFLKACLKEEIENGGPKRVKVRIISYKRANLHPKMKISLNKSTVSKHLRSTVANLLWFEPHIARSDMDIDTFIEIAKNPYGDVYFIEEA